MISDCRNDVIFEQVHRYRFNLDEKLAGYSLFHDPKVAFLEGRLFSSQSKLLENYSNCSDAG